MEPNSPLFVAVIAAIVTNLLSVLFMALSNRGKEIKENTKAVVKLTTQMEFVFQAISKVPQMEKDINEAHKKIRTTQ